MRSLWAAGLLLRRLRADRWIVLLIFFLVAVTSFVFAAAPRLFNRVSDNALRYTVEIAPPVQRSLSLSLASSLTPGADGGVSGVRAYGDGLARDFPASITHLMASRSLSVTTTRFYVTDPPSYETHVSLRYRDGLPDATRLVSGRWPVDRGVPLLPVSGAGSDSRQQEQPVVVEVAFSEDEASEIGVHLGDRLAITVDGSDPLLAGTSYRIGPTELLVVGLYAPLDRKADYWSGDANLLQITPAGSDTHPVAFATAYVPAATYPTLWASGLPFHYEWRFLVDPQRLDAGAVPRLQMDLRRLGVAAGSTELASGGGVQLHTGLPGILDRYAAQRALSESVLSIATIGPFGLAGGALGMVAFLLIRRRRATLALARGRGASGSLVLGTQLWEAILVAGSAALVGWLLAVMAIPARSSPLSADLAAAVGGASILLLVGVSWPTARRPLGQLDREDPPVLRVAPRRLVIEMTIVVIAGAAAVILRQQGLLVAAPGGTGFNPLVAAVPVLAGLAAGIIAMRLYLLPIRGLGWLAARRRDLVPVLGLRTIGRHPAAANLPLLVLMLTAAFGTFSAVIVSSIDRGQVVASYQEVGADYRLEKIGIGALAPSLDPAAIPGVQAVAPGLVDESAPFASTPTQRASTYLDAVDPAAYADVAAGSPADPAWPDAFLLAPAGDGIGTPQNPIPAILSQQVPVGSASLGTGRTFQMRVAGKYMTFLVVQRRAAFAGLGEPATFAIVPFNWVQAAFSPQLLPPSVMWLRAPSSVAQPLAAAAGVAASTRIVSRYDAYAALHDAPLGAAIAAGYALALLVAALYMALTIIGAVALSAARRTQDLAYLRTLGVTAPQALGLTVVEHAPLVVVALVPGVALGIGLTFLLEPGLGLATFAGTSHPVALYLDWPTLALLLAALIGVVAVAVTAGTWVARRARLVDALRIGED